MSTPEIDVIRVPDFVLTGLGTAPEWRSAERVEIAPVQPGPPWRTEARVLWSETGLYFLVECEDEIVSCTEMEDFDDLFREDVVEVFLQPDPRQAIYFEYEVSPMGRELPLLINNRDGAFHGWLPWKYEGARKCRVLTAIRGGERAPMSRCEGWTAEFFIPFALFHGIAAVPGPGSVWLANICRIDQDQGASRHFTWSPSVGTNFHDFAHFGLLKFL